MPVTIRRAVPEDAAALARLASRIYYETFGAFDKPDDIRLFLASTYREDLQRAEIENRAMITLLAEDGVLVGYAQVRRSQPPACVTGPGPVEIMRFYVQKAHHGRGVAPRLMAEVERASRSLGAKTLWLGVWERNDRAFAFYRKYGFREVGEKPFIVGTDVQRDVVLERTLGDAPG